ncbi:hypothetical protein FJT64_017585 [Amphibalanus amphitrite]|uniref:Uncharacterized protein n=1 Tax=Amphibalanus amphitrite TaxID=1232801 RepID=A0A6A4XBA5_AMPAM|nr:hypothetical protein FJT64_017585 [Amphibalanus amphitrite]
MIGAMPAIAVRHQRGHQAKSDDKTRLGRPSTLMIDHRPGHSGALSPSRLSTTASPAAPEPPQPCSWDCGMLCGRLSLLHVIVVLVLLGITLLVVGLVQLAPDAAMGPHKLPLIGTGAGLLLLGFTCLVCMCLFQKISKRRSEGTDGGGSGLKVQVQSTTDAQESEPALKV